jgi:hypothetical protein
LTARILSYTPEIGHQINDHRSYFLRFSGFSLIHRPAKGTADKGKSRTHQYSVIYQLINRKMWRTSWLEVANDLRDAEDAWYDKRSPELYDKLRFLQSSIILVISRPNLKKIQNSTLEVEKGER